MALAIFDLDNTLLAGDSDHAWGNYLVQRKLVDTAQHQQANDYFYQQYQAGTLDIHEYVQFVVTPLKKLSPDELEKLRIDFLRDVVENMVAPGTQALLRRHREAGDELLIITATIDVITAPIAQLLEVPNLLATIPERSSSTGFTGRIDGTPAFQEGKIERLQGWLDKQPRQWDEHWFYSDSHNDLPLLRQVDHPVAVDPDDHLRAEAERQSWPIISLR